MGTYFKAIESLLKKIESEECEAIKKIAMKAKKAIDEGGVLYVFGTGHSTMIVEEAFHRAGGLVPVYPVMESILSPHVSPKIAGKLERVSGISSILIDRANPTAKDLFFIVSNSGVNATAVEMALECEKRGIESVAITSLDHSTKAESRHASKKKLFQVAKNVLNNHCPPGDAILQKQNYAVASGSSIANIFIWNTMMSLMCDAWDQDGKKPPVYLSANLPGGDTHNEVLEKQYKHRVPFL